jgi:hypothetical protein
MRLAAIGFVFLLATAARADEAQEDHAPVTTSSWYGWQVLLADAASTTVVIVGINNNNNSGDTLADGGLVGLAIGAPIIHLVHRRWGAAIASAALRVAVPLAIGYWAGQSASCGTTPADTQGCGWGKIGATFGGFVLGAIIVEGIDVIGLSWDHKIVRPPTPTMTPTVFVTPHSAGLGLGGSF